MRMAIRARGGRARGLARSLLYLIIVSEIQQQASAAQEHKRVQGTSQKVSRSRVVGVVGYTADIPCEVTPLTRNDAPILILWYKDIFGTPIYSYDMRQDLSGRHWMDRRIFGDRASFHIEETGAQTKDHVKILRSYLRIEKLDVKDAGPYRCRVDFKKAPTRNVKVKLSLIELPSDPVILSENGTRLSERSPPMKVNESLKLTCETHGGSPLPDLTWWKRPKGNRDAGEQLMGHQEILSNKKVRSTVTLSRLQRSDLDAEVGCMANNTDLVMRRQTNFKIAMILPPVRAKIVHELSYFLSGKSYNVSCQVQGSQPAAYTKVKIGQRDLDVEHFHMSPNEDVSTTRVQFVPSEADHGSFLSCRAENPHLPGFAVEDQWKINVHYLPRTELFLPDTLNRLETDLGHVIKPGIQSSTNPFYTAPVIESDMDGQFAVSTLRLRSVSGASRGNYSCLAENLVGNGISRSIELRIRYSPVCQRKGALLWYIGLNETVELPCQVRAYPDDDVTYKWSYEDPKKALNQESASGGSQLRFRAASLEDFGTILCRAENAVGTQREACIFEVKPEGIPRIDSCHVVSLSSNWLRVACRPHQPRQDPPAAAEAAPEEISLSVQVFDASTERLIANETFSSGDDDNGDLASINATLLDLPQGRPLRLELTANNSWGSSKTYTLNIQTRPGEEDPDPSLVVVVVEATESTDSLYTGGGIPIKDPIRLLPVVGILAAVVIVLILVVVIIIVIIRSRNNALNGATDSKTHISFNRALDTDIEPRKNNTIDRAQLAAKKDQGVDKSIIKNLEKLDSSYEQLSEVAGNSHKYSTSSNRDRSGRLNRPASMEVSRGHPVELPPKTGSLRARASGRASGARPGSKRSSLIEHDYDYPRSGPQKEVPVGALCVFDDSFVSTSSGGAAAATAAVAGAPTSTTDTQTYALLSGQELLLPTSSSSVVTHTDSSGADHFVFKEAIQAPIPVNKIGQIVICAPENSTVSIRSTPNTLERKNSKTSVRRESLPPPPSMPVPATPKVTFAPDTKNGDEEDSDEDSDDGGFRASRKGYSNL